MVKKFFNTHIWALIAVIITLATTMANAEVKTYKYEGILTEIKDRNVTIINDRDKYVVHAIIPANIKLTPTYVPGERVLVTLTKTNIGVWNLIGIRKISN